MQPGEFQSGMSVLGFDHCVACHFQVLAGEFAHAFFIFNQQDCFRALRQRLTLYSAVARWGALLIPDARQVNLETRSAAWFAVYPHVAAALFDDAVHGGEAEASALALFLGGE